MIFFLTLGVEYLPFLLSVKTEDLHAGLNERAEAATSSYSVEVDFLQYIYSVLAAKNH